jgi:hypothetical protein
MMDYEVVINFSLFSSTSPPATLFTAPTSKIHIASNNAPSRLQQNQQFIQVVIHHRVSSGGGPSIGRFHSAI